MGSKVEIVQSLQEFAALEEEWEDLYHESSRATPFQSWAWLYSWWEFYGEGYELRLVTMRNDTDLLVGIMPLMLERKLGLRRLLFVGTGQTDYLDVLARGGWEDEVLTSGMQALRQMGHWQVADLQQVRPDAAAWGIFHRWEGPRACVSQNGCPVIAVKPQDELFASLSSNLRSTVRRALRRAETDGVRCIPAEPDAAEHAARRLVALHREMWQGRRIGPEHLTRRFESYVIAAARRMMVRGFGGISEFWRDEEVMISDFWVSRPGFFGTYMLGASQEAIRRYQWSSLYIWDALNTARSKNSDHLDLLRGEDRYKLRWSSRVVANYRMIIGRHRIAWTPYAWYHILYSSARRYVSSESAPRWVENTADVYRALRHSAARYTKSDKRP